ncbi:MAG TPA: LysM domain-containing protein [Rhodocyclaceae bacterium]|nr:LysM domain-containing protein [Rhodocyclaceae bacterium]
MDNPPDRHIVVPGDTLWAIAGKFLKEPWRWPEVWRLNKEQIRNPHRIYPGDIVVLDTSSGTPQLKVAKPVRLQPQVYSEPNRKEVPSIPPNVIEPFLSQPLIVDTNELETAPRIIAGQDDHQQLGRGDTAYVTMIPDASEPKWQIYRPGKPLKDPENGQVLGLEAMFLGNARLVEPGAPATVQITVSREEITRGDRLVPAGTPTLISYVPHRPEANIAGRVVSVYGGLSEAGRNSILALNRGSNDGLEIGHVLALFRNQTKTGYDAKVAKGNSIPLPEERYAVVFVFRVFERVAYALVMEASKPVIIGDAVRNP